MTVQTDLYQRAKNIFQEIVTLEEDVAALLDEFVNTPEGVLGLPKKEAAAIVKAAEVYVRNSIHKEEEKIMKTKEFIELYKEMTGEYD